MLTDFSNLYAEGKWWLAGTHALTYPFAYPPSSLPFFGFLAQFDFGVAAQIWTAFSLTLFLIAMFSVASGLKPSRRYLFVSMATLLFFTSYGVRAELQLGQANLLLVGLTILSLAAHRSKHMRSSATLLAAGTLLKGPPVLFLLYFVVFFRDLRYLLYFAESTVAILGVTLAVVPVQLYWVWLTNVFPTLFFSAALPINESVTGPVALAGLSNLTPSLFVLGVCMFAGFAYRARSISTTKRRGLPLSADAMFLMNSLVVLLLGTRSWPQDYVWVILPVALFLSGLLVHGAKTPYFMFVGLAAFVFNLNAYPIFMYYLDYYPITLYFLPRNEMIPTGLIAGLLMVPALVLFFIHPQAILRNYNPHRSLLNGRK